MKELIIELIEGHTISIIEDELVSVSYDEDMTLEELAFELTYTNPSNPGKKEVANSSISNFFEIETDTQTFYLPKKSVIYAYIHDLSVECK